MKEAYFAGGCFWCITPVFRQLAGVESVISGYCGGREVNPTYEDVKHQRTGHRECICIAYAPEHISYQTLLEIYLRSVDPFDPGGQFIDRGFSYTLAIFFADDQQRELARQALDALQAQSGKQVCISLERLGTFYPAEEYHQDYDLKNPEAFHRELEESGRLRGIT